MDERDEDVRLLRSCVRDLVALSAVPSMWIGRDAPVVLLEAAINQAKIWLRTDRLRQEQHRGDAALDDRESESESESASPPAEVEVVALVFGGIVGRSSALREILAQVELVAPTEATVMLLGESGTGKELFAQEIHERSRRAGRPLIKVNCSAIPREMFESEFFGHVRGAFTGAMRDRPGRFQLAQTGTIFLDEVGDLPLDLQPKLLRVLQEGQYERVGDDTTRAVDVRVIAATHRDLRVEIGAGRFREDLYYRLNVFPIDIPPLRERKEDLPLLTAHFAALAATELGVARPCLREEQLVALEAHDWPGNVRELQNVVERAVILARGGELRLDQVIASRGDPRRSPASSPPAPSAGPCPPPPPPPHEIVRDQEWRRRERANVVAALTRAAGKIYGPGGAAELLGIKPSTLQSRLRALGISARERP